MRVAGLAALGLVSLLLAGCQADDGAVPDQDGEGRYVIHLTADNRFDPAEARVPSGATVAWVVDGGFHDVSADDGSFSSSDGRPLDADGYPTLLGPGETYTHTFDGTGKWVYWCHTHHEHGMKGVLAVR